MRGPRQRHCQHEEPEAQSGQSGWLDGVQPVIDECPAFENGCRVFRPGVELQIDQQDQNPGRSHARDCKHCQLAKQVNAQEGQPAKAGGCGQHGDRHRAHQMCKPFFQRRPAAGCTGRHGMHGIIRHHPDQHGRKHERQHVHLIEYQQGHSKAGQAGCTDQQRRYGDILGPTKHEPEQDDHADNASPADQADFTLRL